MTITKATEKSNWNGHPQTRLGERERATLDTADQYSPAAPSDWTSIPGVSSAPSEQDDALDKLASAVAVSDVQEASGTISSAQLLAMNASPIELIAAPGAGICIIVEEIELFADHGGTDYVAEAGEDLVIQYASSGVDIAFWDDADRMVSGSADERDLIKPVADLDLDDADNEAVEASILSGELASGDGDLKWRIRYRLISQLV